METSDFLPRPLVSLKYMWDHYSENENDCFSVDPHL